jgi:leader peptidase (prepilin peptidase) / N-methyltransferase
MHVLRKTCMRTARFMSDALTWRAPDRQYAPGAWGLVAGAVYLAASLVDDPIWPCSALVGLYLMAILAAVCAIDARYGIIPNSLVVALAIGGLLQSYLLGQTELSARALDAVVIFAAGCIFRATYRYVRGHDGLGFGDVKFATAAVLWIGIAGVPGLLLIAVASALGSLLILRAQGHDLSGKQAISFGPHLAIGLWFTWILGPLQFNI